MTITMTTITRRLLMLAAASMTITVAVSAPATAAPTHNRADAAAGWLARQMVDGERFEVDFGGTIFPDQGLTLDAVYAFAATKTARTNSTAAMAWLAQPAITTGYIGDGVTEAYVGGTAKLALAVKVTGGNPAAFGGVDLITRLRGLQAPSGRFSDRSAFGDFSNAFGQSFALLALDRTAAGAPAAAVSYLANSQCADGGFPLFFEQTPCASDIDATAMVTQALLATGRFVAAQQGLGWLISQQDPSGGFVYFGTINSNSTGLAGQALQAGGRVLAAAKARGFLRTLQSGCSSPADERGAVNYTTGPFDPGTANRATAQAILGLAGRGFAHLSTAGSIPGAPTLACP